MSTSGFSSIGSKSIPHLGQVPGLSEITSGCMGQVYFSAFFSTFIRSIPHFGQVPGWSLNTESSGIGQVYNTFDVLSDIVE